MKRLLAFAVVAGLVFAAPARAAITSSSISTPGNGAELFYDGDNDAGSVTVRGTVAGASLGARGDLVCYTVSDTQLTRVVTGVDVSSGSFAINAPLSPIAGFACRLAMIPSGSTRTGAAAAAFAGPAVSVSDQFSHTASGSLYGYYILSGTLPWSFALQSLGECSVTGSYATDTSTLGSFALFAGNGCLPESSGTGAGRSALQIDGQNAYVPGAIPSLATQAGFEPLSYSAIFNPAHDVVGIGETDPAMGCDPPATFPPTSDSCPALHDAGIQVQQTTRLLPGGQVARVTDRFTSVDGHSHALDILFGQSVQAAASGKSPGFAFPGQTSLAAHGNPDTFASFPSSPSSIIVIGDASGFQPATSNPIGAITVNRPPGSATFTSARGAQMATFLMHYANTVPPGGSVVYDWSYSQASTLGALANLEPVERDRFGLPSVVISKPRDSSTVNASRVRVSGRARDAVGVASLSVSGRGVTVRAGGAFAATVSLRRGKNTIRAVATNVAGNSSGTAVSLTYKPLPPCKVPRLRGKTLSAAKRALRHAGCGLGRVKSARSRSVGKGRVISSRPGARARRAHGTKVALLLSRGR